MLPKSQIAVTFEHMQTAADSARGTATYIDDQLSDLMKVLNPIVATWTGTAATIPRVTLDSVKPLGEVVEEALAFLEH